MNTPAHHRIDLGGSHTLSHQRMLSRAAERFFQMNIIRVAIADDSSVMRMSLRLLFRRSTDVELVGESSDGQEAIDSVKLLCPDVLVMDIRMPALDGFSVAKIIKDLEISTRVILISSGLEEYMMRKAVEAGAQSYVQKDNLGKLLLPAIRAVYQGETFFGS